MQAESVPKKKHKHTKVSIGTFGQALARSNKIRESEAVELEQPGWCFPRSWWGLE